MYAIKLTHFKNLIYSISFLGGLFDTFKNVPGHFYVFLFHISSVSLFGFDHHKIGGCRGINNLHLGAAHLES